MEALDRDDSLRQAKAQVYADVEARSTDLLEASHHIHANPELCFEEHEAHATLTSMIAGAGIEVERGAYGLETAFAARVGSGGPHIAVLCEYDALPEIGHGCGHNIIATAGLGAGLAAAAVAEKLGGTVSILGTPAEEGGGGKVMMIDRGAFDDVDAAVMVHPAGADLTRMNTLAVDHVIARYAGAAAHASAAPEKGRNALDAAVLGYTAIGALRQHIRPDERIHGIFTHGGDKPNIVPERAETEWYVRSPRQRELDALKARVVSALESGAHATGCAFDCEWVHPTFSDMVDNTALLALYVANAAEVGRTVDEPEGELAVYGSTDMGNVSYVTPSLHPMIASAPAGTPIHTRDFAQHAASDLGDAAVIDGAKILAATVIDLLLAPDALAQARSDFEQRLDS